MKKAFTNIMTALFGGVMGFVAFLLFKSVINLILAQVFTNETLLTAIDAILITPFCVIISAIVSKRVSSEAYVFYAIVCILGMGNMILALKYKTNLDTVATNAVASLMSIFFYYKDARDELRAKRAEAAKRAARIEAGLPPTEEEEEELRRQAELEAAMHPVYDPETWDETLYNENEPDMWDEPVEDEDEFLSEEYHGAYENMPEEEEAEEEDEPEMTEDELRIAERRSGRRSRSH